LTRETIDLSNGHVRVPDGPGHGFELDLDAVARAHERYREQGAYRSVEPAHAGGLRWQ
jgi:glucarate dehydratase